MQTKLKIGSKIFQSYYSIETKHHKMKPICTIQIGFSALEDQRKLQGIFFMVVGGGKEL